MVTRTTTKTAESAAAATASLLETTKKRYEDSQKYQEDNWYEKWKRDQLLEDSERYMPHYVGMTDTVVPMVKPTIETMVTALTEANLRFDYKCSNPMSKSSSAPLNAVVDEWWDEEGWDIAIEELCREFLGRGMAAGMWSWGIDRPELDWGAMRDYIVDPTVKRPKELQQSGHYAGRRYFVRKGALDDFEVVDANPDSPTYGQMVKRYKMPNVDPGAAPTKDDNKAELEKMFGDSTLADGKDQQDEIIELWDVDRVVTLLNRKFVIEDAENPYKARHRQLLEQKYMKELDSFMFDAAAGGDVADTVAVKAKALETIQKRAKAEATGVNPFFFFRNYRKISLFYADSEIHAIWKEVERLNDNTNMEDDAVIKRLAAQRELDPEYEDWIDLINRDPDTVYPFKNGSLTEIVGQDIPPASFANRTDSKNMIREATGIDQIAKGGQSASGTTATEVVQQQQSTGQRIESKARILEKDGLYWMAWVLFKLIQLYQTTPIVVEVNGTDTDAQSVITLPNGKQAVVFYPEDYTDDWHPAITLEVDAKHKKQKDLQDRRAEYQILIQDPTNNLQELKKRYYPKMFDLSKEDLDAIMTPTTPPVGGGAGLPVSPDGMGVDGAPIDAGQSLPNPAAAPGVPQ